MVKYYMMDDEFSFVPHHMRDGFKLYIECGILPGSFGTAVLENDLAGAIGKADSINQNHLKGIVSWIYNFAPSDCWGSKAAVEEWVIRGGLSD